jgi:hypothetical protein
MVTLALARRLIWGCVVVMVAFVASASATTVHGATATTSVSAQAVRTSEPWDLVYISDSSGWGVAGYYARRIRRDLGVSVRVHDEWQGDLRARTILERLRTPGDPWVPLIRNAEVIVVYGNPVGLGIKWVDSGFCFVVFKRPPAVGPGIWRPYVATLKAIYKRIFEIRNGKPVILRTANWYVPVLKDWEGAGIRDACMALHKSWFAAIARAARAYRVPMADVNRAFNGPSRLEDPIAKGYIQPDGVHPSDKGRAVIAKTLAAVGYKRVTPPR